MDIESSNEAMSILEDMNELLDARPQCVIMNASTSPLLERRNLWLDVALLDLELRQVVRILAKAGIHSTCWESL
jgi:hypothetical protein